MITAAELRLVFIIGIGLGYTAGWYLPPSEVAQSLDFFRDLLAPYVAIAKTYIPSWLQ